MRQTSFRRFAVVLMGVVALVAAACGSSSTGSTSSPSVQTLKVALIEPSLRNDLAFSQSMFAALQSLAGPMNLQIAVTDNAFNVTDAANAMHQYAASGYNLVIAHGSQYGGTIQQLAPQFPKTSFAWGTAGVTFGQPNVFAYQANSQEGGYVEGYEAALLSKSKVLGVIGPIDVGDAHLYVVGFKAGALAADPHVTVRVSFTGSFSDTTLMSTAATSYVSQGADVLTGTSQSVVGAIGVAKNKNVAWFGTQWDQSSLASSQVVASQVYDWTGIVKQMVTAIRGGVLGGATYTITLGNDGEKIAYNPSYSLPASVKSGGDGVVAKIISGAITPPTN
ncbi:MAG TPA: BMP family protein [Candidatus Dormibacteraeota bacterium]|nr:BMP family protein [Candidatus Dormibacteraeota bacterium]